MEKAKVYFTKEITSESLIRIYEALGRQSEDNNDDGKDDTTSNS